MGTVTSLTIFRLKKMVRSGEYLARVFGLEPWQTELIQQTLLRQHIISGKPELFKKNGETNE